MLAVGGIATRLLASLATLLAFLWINSVPTTLTPDDRRTFDQIFAGMSLKTASFDDQVATITAVLETLDEDAPSVEAIPLAQSREPSDLLRWRRGSCYDRTRFVEKALSYEGLKARHVAAYAIKPGQSSLSALLTAHDESHALSEIKTSRGWMLVDPFDDWIGLTADGRVLSADAIARDPSLVKAAWDHRVEGRPHSVIKGPFVHVVGLYSRNGEFYWPYIPFPDINWSQFGGWLFARS